MLFMCTVMTEIMAGTLLLWKKQQDTEEQRLYQNLEKMVTKKKVRDLKAGQLDSEPRIAPGSAPAAMHPDWWTAGRWSGP